MSDSSVGRNGRPSGEDRASGLFRQWLRALVGHRPDADDIRETIEELIEDSNEDMTSVEHHERVLIANVLNMRDVTVQDVMVPRADIIAIDIDTSLDQLLATMSDAAHSRLPVYRDTLDDVVGMVHIKDVLQCIAAKRTFVLADILRRVVFAAPSMRIMDLLLEMRQSRTHMAMVVDEFGGIDGLITIEDLVEEIVGEIEDEHDREVMPQLDMEEDGSAVADARVALEDFEDRFGEILDDEEKENLDTLGGLVFSLAGRVPTRGEILSHPSGLQFEILDADPRRVRRLRVRNLPQVDETPDQ